MGWKLKALAFVIALGLLRYGGWIFAIPLFLYTFSGLIFRRRRKHGQVESPQAQMTGKRNAGRLVANVFGVLLIIIALIAFAKRGTFSPLVLGFFGSVLLLWRSLSRSSHFTTVRAVKDSILLRGTINHFTWAALAEVKLVTRDLGKALLGVSETILVVASEKPSIYVAVRAVALRQKSAQEKILEKLREVNKTTAPLGALLLPLNGERAASVLGFSVEPVEVDVANLSSFLSATPYDLLSLEAEYGLVKSIGVYRKVEERKDGRASLIPSREIPPRSPFAAEVFRSIGSRVEWPNPDAYTAFLTSIFSTRYASRQVRMFESDGPTNSQTVVVRALASPPVELTKVQLGAIEKIYDY